MSFAGSIPLLNFMHGFQTFAGAFLRHLDWLPCLRQYLQRCTYKNREDQDIAAHGIQLAIRHRCLQCRSMHIRAFTPVFERTGFIIEFINFALPVGAVASMVLLYAFGRWHQPDGPACRFVSAGAFISWSGRSHISQFDHMAAWFVYGILATATRILYVVAARHKMPTDHMPSASYP